MMQTSLKKTEKSRSGNPPALSDQAYALIKNDIIICELAPGSEVTETEMAQRYGFGKAPVRAGLSRLFQDGLVQPLPRRGYLISPVTLKDIHECMAIRMMLEPAAARLAVGKIEKKMLNRLRKDNKASIDRRQTVSYEANRKFHIAIAEATGNQRLVRMITELINQMERVSRLLMKSRAASVMKSEYVAVRADHNAILDAIEVGDLDAAERASRQHLQTTQAMIMDSLIQNHAVELRVDSY